MEANEAMKADLIERLRGDGVDEAIVGSAILLADELTALRERVAELEEALEAADEAWEGLKQTQLAASAVGVEMAQGLREGYGLNLTVALRAQRREKVG